MGIQGIIIFTVVFGFLIVVIPIGMRPTIQRHRLQPAGRYQHQRQRRVEEAQQQTQAGNRFVNEKSQRPVQVHRKGNREKIRDRRSCWYVDLQRF